MTPEEIFTEGVEAQKVAHLLIKGNVGQFAVPPSGMAHDFIRSTALRLGLRVLVIGRRLMQITHERRNQ